MSQPKTEAVVRAAKTAYLQSATRRYDLAMADVRRWSRKMTIAQNKLDDANRAMSTLAQELAREKDGAK